MPNASPVFITITLSSILRAVRRVVGFVLLVALFVAIGSQAGGGAYATLGILTTVPLGLFATAVIRHERRRRRRVGGTR
jgi:hypothetical protein